MTAAMEERRMTAGEVAAWVNSTECHLCGDWGTGGERMASLTDVVPTTLNSGHRQSRTAGPVTRQ